MSTQYETQGYTINNAGRRLVVDPITRIEGHMRCEVKINDERCDHQCRLLRHAFRGLEIILQGRDLRDAWAFVERICGVCTACTPSLRFTPSKTLSVLKCRTTPDHPQHYAGNACATYHLVHFYQLAGMELDRCVRCAESRPAENLRTGAKSLLWPNHFLAISSTYKTA
ncbi:nickel-dependent hydrogenase large subunit [Escherichia coli]